MAEWVWLLPQALEKKGISHLEEKELKERNKRIQEDNRLELQKVKQLRLEREREKAMREQELELLQREKEAEHFKTWEEQEDSFHLRQAKLRCALASITDLFPCLCGAGHVDSYADPQQPVKTVVGVGSRGPRAHVRCLSTDLVTALGTQHSPAVLVLLIA